jgi:hypothetical protein
MRRRAAPGDGRSSPKERSPSRHARRERHPPLTPDDLPNDFEETVLETFHETETEAQITMILAELPDEVIEAIEDFEITHSVDRDRLLGLAPIALAGRTDLLGQACAQLIDDPGSFTGRSPARSRIRFYVWREHALGGRTMCAKKYQLCDDAAEPTD